MEAVVISMNWESRAADSDRALIMEQVERHIEGLIARNNWVQVECPFGGEVILRYGAIFDDGTYERSIASIRYYLDCSGTVRFVTEISS